MQKNIIAVFAITAVYATQAFAAIPRNPSASTYQKPSYQLGLAPEAGYVERVMQSGSKQSIIRCGYNGSGFDNSYLEMALVDSRAQTYEIYQQVGDTIMVQSGNPQHVFGNQAILNFAVIPNTGAAVTGACRVDFQTGAIEECAPTNFFVIPAAVRAKMGTLESVCANILSPQVMGQIEAQKAESHASGPSQFRGLLRQKADTLLKKCSPQ